MSHILYAILRSSFLTNSEILETKKSCFGRDCNEQLHAFGEICKKYVFVTKIDKYVAKICNHWLYESYVEFFTVHEMLPTSASLQFVGDADQ